MRVTNKETVYTIQLTLDEVAAISVALDPIDDKSSSEKINEIKRRLFDEFVDVIIAANKT